MTGAPHNDEMLTLALSRKTWRLVVAALFHSYNGKRRGVFLNEENADKARDVAQYIAKNTGAE